MFKVINKKILVLMALCLLLLINIYPTVSDNILLILTSKALFASYSTDFTVEQLRQIMRKTCAQTSCESERWTSSGEVIQAADRLFLSRLDPLIVVSNSADIPANSLLPRGPSAANQENPESGILYSEGYFQVRVFLDAESKSCWRFDVRAMNDDPPPVNLALWLDSKQIGEMSFTRGDQTWENHSVYYYTRPGAYWLRVWYVNDYLDRELNVDRNAYMESIQIERIGEALCESN